MEINEVLWPLKKSKDPCYFVLGQGSELTVRPVSSVPDNKSKGNWGCCGEYEIMFVNCSESRECACICRSVGWVSFCQCFQQGVGRSNF